MDNYTLRRPDPNGPMPMAMAADVDRATWAAASPPRSSWPMRCP